MDISIVDGTGKGYGLLVDSDNYAHVFSVGSPIDQHVNMEVGTVFGCVATVTPAGGGSCFLYIKNTSDQPMHLTNFRLHSTGANEGVQIKLKDTGTAAGGTTLLPVNKNTAKGIAASCVSEYGVNITGLTGGSIVDILWVEADTKSFKFEWTSDLIVAKNDIISFYAITGAIPLTVTATIYFYDYAG